MQEAVKRLFKTGPLSDSPEYARPRPERGTRNYRLARSELTLQTASTACSRAVDLRHTAPTCLTGAGLANGRIDTPLACPYAPRVASSGRRVTPAPVATICRRVSRLVARKSCFSFGPMRLHTSNA